MKKVLIVSDNHGDSDVLEDISDRHGGEVDGMIHCGDSELPYDSRVMIPFHKVKGNCDFGEEQYPAELTEKIAGLRFFVTHGHLFDVKMSPMALAYRAQEKAAQVICFGHSHIAACFRYNGMIFINPGSIRLPRMRREKTYAIAEYMEDHRIQVKFYNENGHVVEDLSKTFEL